MNYSASQKIVVWLDRLCRPVPPNRLDAAYRLVDYVSSKGPFFATSLMKLSDTTAGWKEKGLTKPGKYWTVIAAKGLPGRIMLIRKKVAAVMTSHAYLQLQEPILSKEAVGHLTQLDGRPATIFDVLFGETR
jgi:hypothetical protein